MDKEHRGRIIQAVHALKKIDPDPVFEVDLAADLCQKHNREELLQFTAAIIERGAKSGELRGCDSRRAARFLIESMRGAIVDRYQSASQTGVEKDAEAIVDFFLHGVGVTEKR